MEKCYKLTDILDKYINDENKSAISKSQMDIFVNYKDITYKYKMCLATTFLIMKNFHLKELATIFSSVNRQKLLLFGLIKILKRNALNKDELNICKRDFSRFTDRLKRIEKIIKENLITTEIYPYFCSLCDDNDDIFMFASDTGYENFVNMIIENSKKYNKEHPDIYNAHLVVMKEAKEAYELANRLREEKIQTEKAEKAIAKKAEKEYLAELKKNAITNKTRDRHLGMAGDSYWYNKKKKVSRVYEGGIL